MLDPFWSSLVEEAFSVFRLSSYKFKKDTFEGPNMVRLIHLLGITIFQAFINISTSNFFGNSIYQHPY